MPGIGRPVVNPGQKVKLPPPSGVGKVVARTYSPKPAASRVKLPSKATAGATPRGTAIPRHAAKPTVNDRAARTLATGNNPRGVAISQRKPPARLVLPKSGKLSEPVTHAGGLLAAIDPSVGATVLSSGPAKIAGHLIENTAKDAVNLPSDITLGSIALGKAAYQTLADKFGASGVTGGATGAQTPLEKASTAMAANSLPGLAIQGKWHELGQEASHHPLDTAIQLGGVAGVPGRLIGAVGRSGLAGERLAAATNTARDVQELAPGIPRAGGTHYSKNYTTKLLQQAVERNPRASAIRNQLKSGSRESMVAALTHNRERMRQVPILNSINKRIDQFYSQHKAVTASRLDRAAQQLHELMPKNDLARQNFAHVVIGQVTHPDLAHVQLDKILQGIEENLSQYDLGKVEMTPEEHQLAVDQQTAINKLLYSHNFREHVDQMFAAKKPFVDMMNELDKEAVARGLFTGNQAERRRMMTYALSHMDARIARETGPRHLRDYVPEHYHAVQAEQDVKAAKARLLAAHLEEAKIGGMRGRGTRTPEDTVLRNATKALHEQEKRVLNRTTKSGRANAEIKADSFRDAVHEARQNQLLSDSDRRGYAASEVQAAKAELKDAMERHAAFHQFKGKTLSGAIAKGPDGVMRHLSTKSMRDHMEANGVSPLAYLSARTPREEEIASLANSWRGSRGDGPIGRYTGETTNNGTWRSDAIGMAHTTMRAVGRIQQARLHDDMINRFAVASHLTLADARKVAADYEREHGVKLVPILEHSKGISDEQMLKIRNMQDKDKSDKMYANELLDARLQTGDMKVDDRVSLVPKQVISRYRDHLDVDSMQGPIRKLNRQFRNTVLPTSTKWVVGNTAEAAVRMALKGVGPADRHFLNKVLEGMPDEQKSELMDYLAGGLHFGLNRANVHDALAASKGGEEALAVQRAVNRNWPRLLNVYGRYRDGVYALNRKIEAGTEKAVLGSYLKNQLREMAGSWTNAIQHQQDYLDALRKGIATPQMADDAANYIHDVLGKYSEFSPGIKKFINSAAPFLPWYLNSIKFIYHTLPAHHPLTTAALQAEGAHNAAYVNPDAKSLPSTPFLGIPTGDLQSSLKTGPDSYLNISRYLPSGAFTGSPIDPATAPMLPLALGSLRAALDAKDPFGNDLQNSSGRLTPGSSEALAVALNDLIGAVSGPLNIAHRLSEGGATERNTADFLHWPGQTKPGQKKSVVGALNKVFNPIRPTNLNPTGSATTSLHQSGLGPRSGAGLGAPQSGLGPRP